MRTRTERNTLLAILVAALVAVATAGCDYAEERDVADYPNAEETPGVDVAGAGEDDMAGDRVHIEGEVFPDDQAEDMAEEASDARSLVREATAVVEEMAEDENIVQLLRDAHGVFIVPSYGKAAAVVGARGGEGVLLARSDAGAAQASTGDAGEQAAAGDGGSDAWSDPVFYDIGAISVGPQIGATGGSIAMLLMSEQAVDAFKGDDNFSLDADAGFTLVDYSARAQESIGKGGDVILWSDTQGAFAGVSLGVTDITWDDEENAAFYDQMATAEDVLSGRVTSEEGDALQRALL